VKGASPRRRRNISRGTRNKFPIVTFEQPERGVYILDGKSTDKRSSSRGQEGCVEVRKGEWGGPVRRRQAIKSDRSVLKTSGKIPEGPARNHRRGKNGHRKLDAPMELHKGRTELGVSARMQPAQPNSELYGASAREGKKKRGRWVSSRKKRKWGFVGGVGGLGGVGGWGVWWVLGCGGGGGGGWWVLCFS